MSNDEIKYIEALLQNGKFSEAKERLNGITFEDSIDYWLMKGNIEQKFQNWGAALNAFSKVLEIDKGNQEAQNSIHLIQNILNFWNPEMFNP